MSLKVFLWALTTEPEDAAASDPAQQRAQSQDEWVFRKEGVIWSSDQETSEEMRSGIRNTDRVTVLRETLAAAVRRRVAVDTMPHSSLLLLVLWPGMFLHYIVLGSQRREDSMGVGSRQYLHLREVKFL